MDKVEISITANLSDRNMESDWNQLAEDIRNLISESQVYRDLIEHVTITYVY